MTTQVLSPHRSTHRLDAQVAGAKEGQGQEAVIERFVLRCQLDLLVGGKEMSVELDDDKLLQALPRLLPLSHRLLLPQRVLPNLLSMNQSEQSMPEVNGAEAFPKRLTFSMV
jgi:hypothetical protein